MNGNRREFLVAGAFGLTALAAGVVSRGAGAAGVAAATSLEEAVPAQIGGWQVDPAANITIPRGDTEELETYDQLLTRVYASASAVPVMLLVAYGASQNDTTQLHRPEGCYPAAGFTLETRETLRLPLGGGAAIQARTLTATAPGRIEQILYWSRVGRDFPASTLQQRWSQLRQSMDGVAPDGALVRLSVIAPDYRGALPLLLGFAGRLMEVQGLGRRLLVGSA